jgi:hypothetical protein
MDATGSIPRRVSWLIVAAVLAGCGGEERPLEAGGALPREVSARPERTGRWHLAGDGTLVLEASGELRIEHGGATLVLATEALERPAIDRAGARVAFARRSGDGFSTEVATAAYVDGAWRGPRVLVGGTGTPDRVALTAAGDRIAFVDSAAGVAALWIVPFDGGSPTQLTNQQLRRRGRREPAGFVPVPDAAPPRFADGRLVWTAGGRRHSVELP